MKKTLYKKSMMIATVLSLATVAGCGNSNDNSNNEVIDSNIKEEVAEEAEDEIEKIRIVAATFPEYSWVCEILGENIKNFDVVQLMDTGVDLHSFAPTASDIVSIYTSNMFIYTGGVSATWVEDIKKNVDSEEELIFLDLIEVLGSGVKMEQHIEGMQSESHDHDEEDHEDHDHDDHDHDEEDHEDHDHDDHDHDEEDHEDHDHDDHDHDEEDHEDHDHDDHDEEDHEDHDHEDHDHDDHDHDDHDHDDHDHDDHDHDDHDHDDHDHNHEDEHIWLSLKNAQVLSTGIAQEIFELDPENIELYHKNLNEYIEKLSELDARYEEMVSNSKYDTFIVADRFPFLYLADDYNLNYYAAFSGCSSDMEASFETVIFLAEKIDELEINTVVTTETGNQIADTVVSSTEASDQNILALDSMQSTLSSHGKTYLEIMEENLVVLEKILN